MGKSWYLAALLALSYFPAISYEKYNSYFAFIPDICYTVFSFKAACL